ncbi:hypothetical protein [Prosthecomicrobium sp. N25]|uniref:hypothetical protein n=1 Tax=Prosthecomicrobium sp. N25 TaxID=3129254 RepID=UPI0030774017
MAERDGPRPNPENGGADAARNGPLPRTSPAGTPGAKPDHRRHESDRKLDDRADASPKPYTAEEETYRDPAIADPRDPAQRRDARKGPIA